MTNEERYLDHYQRVHEGIKLNGIMRDYFSFFGSLAGMALFDSGDIFFVLSLVILSLSLSVSNFCCSKSIDMARRIFMQGEKGLNTTKFKWLMIIFNNSHQVLFVMGLCAGLFL